MSVPSAPKDRTGFDVAIICALQIEADAVEAVFDHFWDEDSDRYGKALGDQNAYRTGRIGNHNAVLAYMPGMGKGHAASVAASLRSSFQGIRLALMVGICGGVPSGSKAGIFLGDIIISDEIVPYDFGKRIPGGFRRKETSSSYTSSDEVRAFMSKIRSRKGQVDLLKRTYAHFSHLQSRIDEYGSPSRDDDQLFQANYPHQHSSKCKKCSKNEHCKKAQTATCKTLKCDKTQLVARSHLPPDNILSIHFGRIASGDTVMKSGIDRDKIAAEENVIAFEMESAGIANNLPCLVVKSVCDYADSHKNKLWQKYTAGASSACMKSLLEQWATIDSEHGPSLPPTDDVPEFKALTRANLEKLPWQLLSTGNRTRSMQESSRLSDDNEETSSINAESGYNDNLQEVLPSIKSKFECAISSCKKNRKHLPKNSDLKRILRTQRTILFNTMETLSLREPELDGRALESLKKLCFEVNMAIRTKLEEIQSVIEAFSSYSEPKALPVNFIFRLKNYVEDLQSLTQVLTSSVSRNDSSQHQESLEVSRNVDSRHEFKQFRIIQMVACSLYDAFKTACNVHEVHDVHLSLRPALDGRLERVGFNVAFIQSTEERKAIWINVESAIINQQVCSKIVPGLLPSGSPSMRLKRSAGEQPDQPPISERRGILFQRSSESAATFFQGVPAITIPNLHLQRNFCTLIRRRLNQPNNDECIGLLGDNGTCKHLAYIDGHVNRAAMPASLSELIALSGADNTEGMGLYERVRLSKHLATAVLYYHATPWLKKSWRSDDVQFFPDLERPLLQQGQHGFPYIKTSIHEAGPTKSSSQMPEYHHFIRNPVLFGLGIMLLELAYQAPLRELQQPTDLEKGGTQISADYFTAHRLVEQSHRQVSRSFKIMIKKCLHCDFGHDSDFASVDLQEAFHRDIVVGLENLEKVFWDLQLDDPDMA